MIEINQCKKRYKDFELDCTLHVKPGFITGLIGQNGAGKSTTFKVILNLVKYDSGTVRVLSKNPDKLDIKDKEYIGVVLSDSGFSGYFTISDILSILSSMYSQFNQNYFLSQVNYFNLPLHKQIKDFSTGMKAKLKVLVALSHNAKLLILDEPTAGLDVIARDEILDLLRLYLEEDSTRSILISSHISSDLETLCDDIYMIDQGKIILHEDTDVLLSDYAILKMNCDQFETLDKQYIISVKEESYGFCCLTNQKQYYIENACGISIENGSIDSIIPMMIRGREI